MCKTSNFFFSYELISGVGYLFVVDIKNEQHQLLQIAVDKKKISTRHQENIIISHDIGNKPYSIQQNESEVAQS